MKVITVVYNLNKGGTQRAAQVFCEAYRYLGHDSRLLATESGGPREIELREKGIHLWMGMTSANLAEIFSWSPDVIHLHSNGLKYEQVQDIYEKKGKQAIILETCVFSRPSPWIDLVHVNLVLSKWAKWLFEIRTDCGYSTCIVPNPIKTESFYRSDDTLVRAFKICHGIPEGRLVLGRIGQAIDSKWSKHYPKIMRQINESFNVHFLLVNPPESLKENLITYGLSTNTTVIDQLIGDDALREAYSSMDIFLHMAEIGESFGIVNAEALLCGTPVVTLSTPWADNSQCEVVQHNVGGLVVTRLKNYASAIETLIHDTRLRKTLANRGREHIIQNYDYLKVAQSALSSFTVVESRPSKSDVTNNIGIIYVNSFDKPGFITSLFVRNARLSRFTKLSSGYITSREFIRLIFNRLRNLTCTHFK